MEQQALEKMESAETVLLKILEDATSLRIGLDEEDSEFDLEFITTKLRKIAIYHERISDLGMQVSKISIEVRNGLTAAVNIARHKEAEYRANGYLAEPRDDRRNWLEDKLAPFETDKNLWKGLVAVVSEVKVAVESKAGTLKRLDSDLRLHVKIIEQAGTAGITNPNSWNKAGRIEEMDID